MDEAALAALVARAFETLPEGPVGVALSGGGDSSALLLLAAGTGREIVAVTVDHGLRPESAAEAEAAGRMARSLGVAHEVVRPEIGPGGNLQDKARRARREALEAVARRRGLVAMALGHTLDDQAETLLMRLARGSGLYGLSGMAARSEGAACIWLRPLLGARREDLRALLAARGIGWIDDPSNDDPRFDRVKARAALAALAPLGLGPERLASTAAALDRAAQAVRAGVAALAREAAEVHGAGVVTLDAARLAAAPEEARLRLIAEAVRWVSGSAYTPRLASVEALAGAVLAHGATERRTLAGALVEAGEGRVRIMREPGRAGTGEGAGWDGRWHVTCDEVGIAVRALGPGGLAQLPDWRAQGLPRPALEALPGFWRGDALIAAPFALERKGCHAELLTGPEAFLASLGPR